MKKLLVLAALTVAATPALASKARVNALANSRQIVDVQTTFDKPHQLVGFGDLVTMEWGAGGETIAAAPHAEGGFFKKAGDYTYGAYLGRRSSEFALALVDAGVPTLLAEQNPINLYYATKTGEWTWGVDVKLSSGKKDSADAKSSSSGLALSAAFDVWELQLVQGLTGKSENATDTVESKGMTKVGVDYHIDDAMQAYFTYGMVKAEHTVGAATTTTTDLTAMELGFVNTVVKNDDANFFYGIAYNNTKKADVSDAMTLPVWMGIEANATSWMVMRASVKQSVLINETKDVTGGAGDGDKTDVDSIAFNAGAGLKLGKGMLDVSFGTANTGNFDYAAAGFLTSAAYTYNF